MIVTRCRLRSHVQLAQLRGPANRIRPVLCLFGGILAVRFEASRWPVAFAERTGPACSFAAHLSPLCSRPGWIFRDAQAQMTETDIEAASAFLTGLWRDGKHVEAMPPTLRPATRAQAYAIQAMVERRS